MSGIAPFESAVTTAWRRGSRIAFRQGLLLGFIAGMLVAGLLALVVD